MQYVYLGSMVKERDGCLEGTPNWRIARFDWDVLGGRGIGAGAWFGWGVFVEGRDFCFGGTRNWRRSAIPLGVFVSLWVE